MKERIAQREQVSRTIDSNPRASRQAAIGEVLQAYKNIIQRKELPKEDEALQGKFEAIQFQHGCGIPGCEGGSLCHKRSAVFKSEPIPPKDLDGSKYKGDSSYKPSTRSMFFPAGFDPGVKKEVCSRSGFI
jgi:hypothetical protein